MQTDYIKQQIQNNRHNHITTYYYLLKQKLGRNEKKQSNLQVNIYNESRKRAQSPKASNISIDLQKQSLNIQIPSEDGIQFNIFTPKGNPHYQVVKQYDGQQNAAKKQHKVRGIAGILDLDIDVYGNVYGCVFVYNQSMHILRAE